ncbi:MAG: RNase adapter RapZ [Deltaproteobacteria bacterium]|nr:RNase adapter RapZ [Deltaproteobacteria bacterium]
MESLSVIIVTGISGSGKSTCIRALEDLGFYCVDNLPSLLLPQLLELCKQSQGGIRRVAVGIDAREGRFFEEFQKMVQKVRSEGHSVKMLFLDAQDPVLIRRYSETRRLHPLAISGSVVDGIQRERVLLNPVYSMSDIQMDTTEFNIHELRQVIQERFSEDVVVRKTAIRVVSFGYRYGIPLSADMLMDVRFLPNPNFVKELRPKTGEEEPVSDYVMKSPHAGKFLEQSMSLLRFLLPLYQQEGKAYLTIGFGCTGGRHRSVAMARWVAAELRKEEYVVTLEHRDIGK